MTAEVTAREFEMLSGKVADLSRRLEAIDTLGTRGVVVVQAQVSDLTKDVVQGFSDAKEWQHTHERKHEQEQASRVISRRWGWTFAIAALAAVETPLIVLLSHLH